MKNAYKPTVKNFKLLRVGIITTILILSLTPWGFGQQLTPQVITTTGGYEAAGGISQSYTIGEMSMVQTFSAGGTIITQGFQQPEESVTALLNTSPEGDYAVALYPNPAADNVWLGLQLPAAGNVALKLQDVSGKQLTAWYRSYPAGKTVETLNLSAYPAGTYLLSLNYASGQDGKQTTITRKVEVVK